APELHYRPKVAKAHRKMPNHAFRQHYAEASTLALHTYLARFAKGDAVRCAVASDVEQPNDAFDTYGRFVGTVAVGAGRDVNVNKWLVEQGWAFPAFYASMKRDVIEAFQRAGLRARRHRRGVWSGFTQRLSFDEALRYQRHSVSDDCARKPVLFPKVFR